MKDQKNIERLFQEKFKDFEALPPHDSWSVIANRLNEKKKKRRLIPFWFQLSGIAATLIIVGTLIWNFKTSEDALEFKNNEKIVDGIANDNLKNNETLNSNVNIKNATVKNKNNPLENQKSKTNIVSNDNQNKYSNTKNEEVNSTVTTIISKKLRNDKTSRVTTYNIKDSNIIIATNSKIEKRNNLLKETETIDLENKTTENKEINKLVSNKKLKNNFTQNKTINYDKLNSYFNENETSKNYVNTNNDSLKNVTSNKSNTKRTSLENIIKNDSTLVDSSPKINPLEELLAEKEAGKNEDEKEKEKRSRWAVSTNASPVYFNAVAEGSSLDNRFDANKKEYNNTLSYGVGVNYAINNKLTLKAGVNNLSLDYNTSDISFYQAVVTKPIENVSRNAMGKMLNIESKLIDNGNYITPSGNLLTRFDGAINQQISYVEVPLELGYKILDRKFGIEIIGGLSTLFLNDNSVSIVSNGQEMIIGQANNLNNIHFSSNVGLGFKYSFWKNFNANFQPMFKYQINTFSENSGNFKPYFVGLYSGISFNF